MFDNQGRLLAYKNTLVTTTNTTYALTSSNTYLVVLRYKYNAGHPDQVDLWVDPTSLGNDQAVPPPNITITNGANVTAAFGSVAYYQYANPPGYFVDEIRVATNWAAVTPTTPAPGNLYSVTGGGSGCAGDSFAVGLSGSDSGVSYLLYTNGVFTGQAVNGSGAAVSFGAQATTAIYTVLATNLTTANVGWMASNASVTLLSLPNIATEPVPTVVATNGLCSFNVSSAGLGLNYQWYRNGTALTDGGHVSGSQTATLVISPATTADVATKLNGYYVIVANRCGNGVISTTNALTLDAPANLLWYGDGNSNYWDVAVSTNWNYSGTLGYCTNIFNYGDNVTFDDTSANISVNLNNPNLSPSLITVNGGGGQNYTFTGAGLAGGGSVVMNSLGTLNLDAFNNETGGLVISNGAVTFISPADLGSGPITLAGGTLTAPGNGAVTIANTIIITSNNVTGASDVIQVNRPGGQNLTLTTPLVEVPGGSLDLQNVTTKNTSQASIIFTATNFTFDLPVDLADGSAGGTTLLNDGNTSGTHIWNGVLSDAGGVWRDAAGGTTLLNNTNTFSLETRLTAGSLGVGADSVQSSPPTIDAGPLGIGTFYIDTANNAMELFASGGAHTVANPIAYISGALGAALIIGGGNDLTLSGTLDLTGAYPGTNRVLQITNAGNTFLTGVISDEGNALGLTKTGNGALYLDGVNTFTGFLTNSAGLLAGSGSETAPVFVQSGATLGAGDPGLIPGSNTLSAGLALGGNVLIRVNKSQVQSNDVVSIPGGAIVTGTGTVTVSNVGTPLKVGDTFTIFDMPVTNGNALTISGGGATWNNHLATDGGITVAALAPTTPPVFLSSAMIGTNLVSGVSNGAAGSTYYVLATTNLTAPLSNWTPVSTGTYPNGNFYITNPVVPGTPKKFFILSPNP
jgi:autotransporter-associated beta strand protein